MPGRPDTALHYDGRCGAQVKPPGKQPQSAHQLQLNQLQAAQLAWQSLVDRVAPGKQDVVAVLGAQPGAVDLERLGPRAEGSLEGEPGHMGGTCSHACLRPIACKAPQGCQVTAPTGPPGLTGQHTAVYPEAIRLGLHLC